MVFATQLCDRVTYIFQLYVLYFNTIDIHKKKKKTQNSINMFNQLDWISLHTGNKLISIIFTVPGRIISRVSSWSLFIKGLIYVSYS